MQINSGRVLKIGIPILAVAALVLIVVLWPRQPGTGPVEGDWTCSMHPQVRQSRPGQCPLCGMNLIPVSQLSEPRQVEQRAGVEVEGIAARVTRRPS